MLHKCMLTIDFTSSVPGKLFNIKLMKDDDQVLLLSNVPVKAKEYNYTISNSTITDSDKYYVRIENSVNEADYKDSNKFTIQKKLRVGCKVGSRL